MAAETPLTPTRDEAAVDAQGQSRTALASIAAATLLVVLKLGTGILTGSLGLIQRMHPFPNARFHANTQGRSPVR